MRRSLTTTSVVLGWIAAAALACRDPEPPPLARYEGPAFSIAYPAGWTVEPLGPTDVRFVDTRTHGAWTYTDRVRIELLPSAAAATSRFDTQCGSHVCSGTLERVEGRLRLTLDAEYATDWPGPSAADVRVRLERLAARILPTATIASTPARGTGR